MFTVLVVDDRTDFRAVAGAMLAAGGYRVVGEAGSGAEALAAVAVQHPQVVLLDVQLPDMDGFTVCDQVRRLAPATVVVLCSVRDAVDYGVRLQDCGACGFVTKSALSAAAVTALVTGLS